MTTITIKLSEQAIQRSLKQQEITQIKGSGEPFLMRPHKCRTKGSWYFVSHKGGTKRHKIANYPDLSVKGLLAIKDHLVGKWIKEEEVYQDEFETVGELLAWYRNRSLSDRGLSKKRKVSIKSAVCKHLIPLLGEHRVSNLTKAVIDEDFIWKLQGQYTAAYTKSMMAMLKRAFKQALILKKIKRDPLSGFTFTDFISTKITAKGSKLESRDIPALIKSIDLVPVAKQVFTLLMLMFGTRIGETRQLKWKYIDFESDVIVIPAHITKTRARLTVPLTPQSTKLLKNYQATFRGKSEFLFSLGSGAISASIANDWVKSVSSGGWTAHDLRKLARSQWADLGVDYMVAEMMLNHTLSKLDQAYIHSYVETQKRSALELWHNHLGTYISDTHTIFNVFHDSEQRFEL